MSLKSRLLKLKYYLFGRRKEKYLVLSDIDAERGMSIVQGDQKGKVYIQKKLTEYDIEKYQRLKKKPVDNTPKICHLSEEDGVLTVVEEFVHGDSLEFSLKKNGVMDANKVIDISSQLCAILSDYHNYKPSLAGHDLNPCNIKLSVNSVVSLMECNIEKYTRQNAKLENLPGAERYKAPEMTQPDACAKLGDIYSMGVLMNVLLSGKHPDEALTEGVLSEIIEKCVSLNPADRYQSPQELSEALAEIKKSLPFKERLSSWKRYLIPGFRGKSAYLWLFAAAAYPMLFYVGLFVKFDGASAWNIVNRILFCLTVLVMVFFDGNYLNVQKRIPLVRSRRKILRALGMLIVNAVFLFVLLATLKLVPLIIGLF